VECLAALVVVVLKVGVAINYLHLPRDVLECHLFILLFLRIHILFALSLAEKRLLGVVAAIFH
jgi:hypothetical protein